MRTILMSAFSFVAAFTLSVTNSLAGEVEVLHWWTSGGEAAALTVLKEDLEGKGVEWMDMPVAGGGAVEFPGERAVRALAYRGGVVFGATVLLYDPDADAEITYQIVGEDEADIREGLISVNSPIARGLIGKEEGDEVEVGAPGGVRTFEILDVRYE